MVLDDNWAVLFDCSCGNIHVIARVFLHDGNRHQTRSEPNQAHEMSPMMKFKTSLVCRKHLLVRRKIKEDLWLLTEPVVSLVSGSRRFASVHQSKVSQFKNGTRKFQLVFACGTVPCACKSTIGVGGERYHRER
jgi:hypothetical protein